MAPETAALERTAADYGDSIYRVALQYTRHTADAEDVLQEVLLERLQTKQRFLSPEHERRWLLKVAVNRCRNLLRSRRRRPDLPLDGALELCAPPEPDYRPLYDAVNALPQNQRLAVDLFYFEGYSTAEIAEIAGAREATVRTWLRRARLKLRELLKEEWDYDEF